MPVSIEDLRPHLQAFDFPSLFVEGLGWNHYQAEPLAVRVNEREYHLKPVAEKAGFVVYECDSSVANNIPRYPIRRKIESEVAKRTFEHLIVFVDRHREAQVWQWVKRESGKPAVCREYAFTARGSGDHLLQRIQPLFVSLDEEPSLNIALVASRVRAALDVAKVTKHFYERFRAELTAFGDFIEGITAQGDRDWYASLMLNRMMFVYFVQKQGFLDDDDDYLRNRLKMVQAQSGVGRFQQFYRLFLLRLFHEGLGQPEAQREPDLAVLLGRVPFLNGGLFDVHALERDNPNISIPDKAFEQVFDFFDGYRWHLDERPYREDNEINPDVLGYIFEKYVNQKQMGAYYTKEDITGYISRNTVIPFLFDAAMNDCPVAFGPAGGVWRLLRDDPDRYIYPAVGHGITWNAREVEVPVPLDSPRGLPDDIAVGIDDVSQRAGWNGPAPDEYGLPTETWREVVDRRQRYTDVCAKLAAGEVQEINDLITLNLDIERFAGDVIAQSEGPEILRAFWRAVRGISVLDPTCGSGAFLFAALNVLEPLYIACIERMRGFLADLERSERPHNLNAVSDFRNVLAQVEQHPSERYFILKSTVLNNLYGVDIMEEAVEICKLRLFLKLAAQLKSFDQIEPLPDIDFNVRAGNTLVGFTSLEAVRQAMTIMPTGQRRQVFPEEQAVLNRIEEAAEEAGRAFDLFREQQTLLGGGNATSQKADLSCKLQSLKNELDRYLATEHRIDLSSFGDLEAWRASHRPFHWFVEFYAIMKNGGFDVVIGNPPYVKKKSLDYAVSGLNSFKFPDIYADVVIQSYRINRFGGRCGLIVPLSLNFSFEYADLRKELAKHGTHWLSSYDNIPAALFAGVGQRCTILISTSQKRGLYSTRLFRWRASYRPSLMSNVTYSTVPEHLSLDDFGVPRISDDQGKRLLNRHMRFASATHQELVYGGTETSRLGFSSTARNFISTYLEKPPVVAGNGTVSWDTDFSSSLVLPSAEHAVAALAATSGNVCFWYWLTRGDGFHVTNGLLSDFLAPLKSFHTEYQDKLQSIGELLHEYRYSALVFKKNAGKYVGNYNYQSMTVLTIVADLIFLAGLGASWRDAEALFSFVSLIRSVNESAGEKNIPQAIKSQFPQVDIVELLNDLRLVEVKEWLSFKYNVKADRINALAFA